MKIFGLNNKKENIAVSAFSAVLSIANFKSAVHF